MSKHSADNHDFIRVQGARQNNLGVSGSGKSALVCGSIAAESQRMINETYSAFAQGFLDLLSAALTSVCAGLAVRRMHRLRFR